MSTLSLNEIPLRPAQLKAIEKKARKAGTTAQEYVRQLIERDLEALTFDEIVGPIRDGFERSGVTPRQLEQIVERARKRGSAARKRSRSAPR